MQVKLEKITIEPLSWFLRNFYLNDKIISNADKGYFARMIFAEGHVFEKIGKIGTFLIKELLKIKGISEIYITPIFLRIWVKRDFEWYDINNEIISVLEKALELN